MPTESVVMVQFYLAVPVFKWPNCFIFEVSPMESVLD